MTEMKKNNAMNMDEMDKVAGGMLHEQDQMKNMTLSEDELDQVAGGRAKIAGGGNGESSKPVAYCAFLGVGFGKTERKGNTAYCFLLGGSDGPIGGESQ